MYTSYSNMTAIILFSFHAEFTIFSLTTWVAPPGRAQVIINHSEHTL